MAREVKFYKCVAEGWDFQRVGIIYPDHTIAVVAEEIELTVGQIAAQGYNRGDFVEVSREEYLEQKRLEAWGRLPRNLEADREIELINWDAIYGGPSSAWNEGAVKVAIGAAVLVSIVVILLTI